MALLLGIGFLLLGFRKRPLWPALSTRAYLIAMSALAFVLSALYVEFVLGGGPRIIDATTYYLQARTYATGHIGFVPNPPESSHFGRFLLAMPDGSLTGIFPPGYPLLLALGFLLQAPMWMGPLLAVAVTLLTYWVASLCFLDSKVARLAAAMSVCCAVLRYHTAEPMAHGLCAALALACMGCVLCNHRNAMPVAGFCLGWLFATRPVTGAVVGVLVALVAWRRVAHEAYPRRRLAGLGFASLGVLGFLWQQRVAAGQWFQSSQTRYYALSDSPAGCFAYGFGDDIGCRGEHGDFLTTYMQHGYGAWEALGTSLRRLSLHASDGFNVELFVVPWVLAIVLGFRTKNVRWLWASLWLQVLAYAGFYFDGNYPGGGARMLLDVMPFEHVLVAWVLTRLRLGRFAIGTMLLGFAFHTGHDHQALSRRDGGRPMFEPGFLKTELAAHRPRGRPLIYLRTDHGYNLAVAPESNRDFDVVRLKGDASDYAAWLSHGKPPAFRYVFDFTEPNASPQLVPFEPAMNHRFEAEQQWPLLALKEAEARRGFDADCGHPTLQVVPRATDLAPHSAGLFVPRSADLVPPTDGGSFTMTVWVPSAGRYGVQLRATAPLSLQVDGAPAPLGPVTPPGAACGVFEGSMVVTRRGDVRFDLAVTEPTSLDWVQLVEEPGKAEGAR